MTGVENKNEELSPNAQKITDLLGKIIAIAIVTGVISGIIFVALYIGSTIASISVTPAGDILPD